MTLYALWCCDWYAQTTDADTTSVYDDYCLMESNREDIMANNVQELGMETRAKLTVSKCNFPWIVGFFFSFLQTEG